MVTYLSTEGIVRAARPSEIGTHLRVLIGDTFWSVWRTEQRERGPVVEVLYRDIRWYETDDDPDLLVPVVNQ